MKGKLTAGILILLMLIQTFGAASHADVIWMDGGLIGDPMISGSNEYQELLYASSEVSDSLFLSALSKSSGQILRDSTSHERYLVSTSSMNQDLFLTFLTPLSDIEQIVITALFPYILFVLITFFLLICVLYLLSRKITEPIISLADLISTIEDTRTFQTQRFSVYHDADSMT